VLSSAWGPKREFDARGVIETAMRRSGQTERMRTGQWEKEAWAARK
jgi:hypothetical protein